MKIPGSVKAGLLLVQREFIAERKWTHRLRATNISRIIVHICHLFGGFVFAEREIIFGFIRLCGYSVTQLLTFMEGFVWESIVANNGCPLKSASQFQNKRDSYEFINVLKTNEAH